MTFGYIILAIFCFGFFILSHEAGHFAFAKLFHVKILEFSVGMGPSLLSRVGRDGVRYSLRALPIGGFVAMAGETDDFDDPNAIVHKPVWQRLIVMAAGAAVNLLTGFLIMGALAASEPSLQSVTIDEFRVVDENGAPVEITEMRGLRVGDTVKKVGRRRIHVVDDFLYDVMYLADEPVDVTVERDGKTLVVPDVVFPTYVEDGLKFGNAAFIGMTSQPKNVYTVLREGVGRSFAALRMLLDSLLALFRGRYGAEALSGPVGVVQSVSESAQHGAESFFFLIAILALNLGLFNLLPLPALDGGRIFFLLVELVLRRPVPAKYEAAVHALGFLLLMGLMVFVTYNDIVRLVTRS